MLRTLMISVRGPLLCVRLIGAGTKRRVDFASRLPAVCRSV